MCYLCTYCALNATSKFDFKQLFDFIKIFKEYLKQPIQNSLKMYAFSLPHFHNSSEKLKLLQVCGSTLDVPTIATGAHLDLYLARAAGELTGHSRCK